MQTPGSNQNLSDNSHVVIPPPLIYAGVFGIGYLLQLAFPFTIFSRMLNLILAVLCIIASSILGIWCLFLFLKARTGILPLQPSTTLVIEGPYRFSRNPMYLSLSFIYAGAAFLFEIFWALLLLPIAMLIIHFYVIRAEEHYLEQCFGEEYRTYKKRVRRWL